MKSNDWRHKNVARYTPGKTKILYFFNCLLDGMHTKIKHICDFSRGRLNVRVKTLAFNLCSEVTNVLYLSFWVLFVGNKHTPEFQLLKKPQPFEISLKSSSNLPSKINSSFSLTPNVQSTIT